MTKLRALTSRKLTDKLKSNGFRFHKTGKGTHGFWIRDSDGKTVPVPNHKGKTMKKGTIRAIIREANLSLSDFFE